MGSTGPGTHGSGAAGFSTDEVERAWERFQDLGARGRDWPAWAALFTDDATYIEHCLGRFSGAGRIREWILHAMDPVACMTFSVEWAIIQPPYVAINIWNHLPDPAGEGTRYSFSNLSLLIYAGDGKWSWEEDFYAPAHSTKTVVGWYGAGGKPAMDADPSITHVSLGSDPAADDPAGVAAMVEAWRAGEPRYTGSAVVWDHAIDPVPAPDAAVFVHPADVVVADGRRAFLRCGNTGVALTHGGAGRIAFEERAHNPSEAG
jgi:hypothetical protein